MSCHKHSRRHHCDMGGSSLLKVMAVGALMYVGFKAMHRWHHDRD